MLTPTRLFLFRRSNGIYYLVYDDNGKRRWKSTGCSRKAAALKALTEFRALIAAKTAPRSLAAFLTEFQAYAEAKLAPTSKATYMIILRHLLAFLGDVPLHFITVRDVDRYVQERRKRIKPVTINIELRTLRAILAVAQRWGYMTDNPFANVKLLRLPETRAPYLRPEDLRMLVAAIKENWLRELVCFCVGTGARRSEAINLRWDSVDLKQRVIHIESGGGFVTKSRRNRIIPMSNAVHELVRRKREVSNSGFVFNRRGMQVDGNYATHVFKRYVRKLGLDERLHLHSTRHSFASLLVLNGTSLYQVQKLMGHADPRTTAGYSHLAPETMHDAVDRIQLPAD